MDDDIRNRFKGAGDGRKQSPSFYERPRQQPRPAPVPTPRAPAPGPLRPIVSPTPPVIPKPPVQPTAAPIKSKSVRRQKRNFPRKLLLAIIFLVLVSLAAYVFYTKHTKKLIPAATNKIQSKTEVAEPKPTGTIRFIATGSNLASESINNTAKKPNGDYDYLPMMADMKPYFEKSDIRLCNQTTPGGGDKNGLALSGYPTFNGPLEWSSGFASLGCNLINLASDHINDKGQAAINATLATLESQKNILATAGANRTADEQSKPRYFTLKQVKFAYLAYTTVSTNKPADAFGVNIYSDELANKQISEVRKNAQLVIVSMNWGTEGNADINADQDRIATNLANQNVDVIIGVGPHVLQPAKVLTGKDSHQTLAWFSLGNFLNSELPLNNLIGGMAIMDFDVASQKLTSPKLLPLYMHYEWTAQQKAAGTVNARQGFKIMPLDLAAPFLSKSQNGTTVEAQTARVTDVITKFAPIKVIKSTEF